jgi:CDP-glycerol glycerophosphotransferase (TagB/SpsB family)
VRALFRDLDRDSDDFSLIETDDILPLLQQADVMLADTSSIISEFLLLHKPVVTFDNQSPGDHLINVTDPQQLMSALEDALCADEAQLNAIRAYADSIHPYRDGRSSERILDAACERLTRGNAHLKSKPLNLYRRLKLRHELRWYRWA